MSFPIPVQLTQTGHTQFLDGRPCFSPDGTTVLFMRQSLVSNGGVGNSDFYQVPIASPGNEQLFFSAQNYSVTRPDWSWKPGNNCIAFTAIDGSPNSVKPGQGFGLLEAISNTSAGNADYVQVSGVKGNMSLSYPSWYPDGKNLAITNYVDNTLLKVDTKSGKVKDQLTNPSVILCGMCSVNQASDDNFCMAAQLNKRKPYNQFENAIFTQKVDGNPTRFSASHHFVGRAPWWSPDGKWIAYEGTSSQNPNGPYQIFLQKSDESSASAIMVTNNAYAVQHPKWSPDGKSLVYAAAFGQPFGGGKLIASRIEMIDVSQYV